MRIRHPLELVSTYALVAYGAWLLCPWWSSFAMSAVFRVLATAAPEEIWGTIIMATGLLQGWTRANSGIPARKASAIGATFVWMVLTLTVWISNPASTAGVVYTVLVFINVLALIYLTRDGREENEHHA